jgi:hypothetical protein
MKEIFPGTLTWTAGIIGPRSPTLNKKASDFSGSDAQLSLLEISIRFFRFYCSPLPLPRRSGYYAPSQRRDFNARKELASTPS